MLVLLPDVSLIVQCYAYFLMLVLLSFINVSHNSFLAFKHCYVSPVSRTDSLHRLTKTMKPFTIRRLLGGLKSKTKTYGLHSTFWHKLVILRWCLSGIGNTLSPAAWYFEDHLTAHWQWAHRQSCNAMRVSSSPSKGEQPAHSCQ